MIKAGLINIKLDIRPSIFFQEILMTLKNISSFTIKVWPSLFFLLQKALFCQNIFSAFILMKFHLQKEKSNNFAVALKKI